jgi:hypothetical protein
MPDNRDRATLANAAKLVTATQNALLDNIRVELGLSFGAATALILALRHLDILDAAHLPTVPADKADALAAAILRRHPDPVAAAQNIVCLKQGPACNGPVRLRESPQTGGSPLPLCRHHHAETAQRPWPGADWL